MSDPANIANNSVARGSRGRFLPGSGGRPLGAKNKLSRDTLTAVQALAGEAVDALRLRVSAGDMKAIELVLERVLPKGGRTIELASTDPHAWADAMAEGEITPEEAARAAAAMSKLRDVAEIDDLRDRLDELERAVNQ